MINLRQQTIRLLLFSVSSLIVILLGELVIRVFSPISGAFWEPHNLYGWRLVPTYEGFARSEGSEAFVRINSKGLRDYEYDYQKGDGTFRIMILGDSFCEALNLNLEEAFHKILESDLKDRVAGSNIEIINTGVSGFGTDNELLYLINEGYKYNPDLIILGFNMGNDVTDNLNGLTMMSRNPYFIQNGGRLEHVPNLKTVDDLGLITRVKVFLKNKSHLYYFIYKKISKNLKLNAILYKIGLMNSPPALTIQNGVPKPYLVFATDYDPELEKAWKITEALLVRLKREAEQISALFAIMIIPKGEQVHGQAWEETLQEYKEMQRVTWDLEKPTRRLKRFLEANKILYLDLLPHMRSFTQKNGKSLYFNQKGHWNKEGHCLASVLVGDFLTEKKLVREKQQQTFKYNTKVH